MEQDEGQDRFVDGVDGRAEVVVRIRDRGAGGFTLEPPRHPDGGPVPAEATGAVARVMARAVDAARARGARELGCRVPVADATDGLRAAFAGAGFAPDGGRIEYHTPLDPLPGELPGLDWADRTADPRGQAALFARCALDSPDSYPGGTDLGETLRTYVAHPDLRVRLDVGSVGGREVAVVCAGVAERGWCTLLYLGLVPEARGRGLGHVAHRHGIAVLRALGGSVYHGGTSADNHAMQACFRRQGCVEHRRFEVWRWLR